mmetsp:Transcript_15941/g.24516  ORF Transcript_15941/g.24516 Transcript_15941/m.24516 type:complete len:388 (+) Transcript_15941:29-1192(+)
MSLGLNTTLNVCDLPPTVGYDCGDQDIQERYYFDVDNSLCRHLNYKGCGGNANNFESMQQCESLCVQAVNSVAESTMFHWYHIVGVVAVTIFLALILCFAAHSFKLRQANKHRDRPPQYEQVKTHNSSGDQQDQKEKCLYVQNISSKCNSAAFELLFKQYGQVVNFEFNRKQNGYVCFVEYKLKDGADRAVRLLDGCCVEGRNISVQKATHYNPASRSRSVSQVADRNETEKSPPQKIQAQRANCLHEHVVLEIKVSSPKPRQPAQSPNESHRSMHSIAEEKESEAQNANKMAMQDWKSTSKSMYEFDSEFDEFAPEVRAQRLSIVEDFRQGLSNSLHFEDTDDENAKLSELHNFVKKKLTIDHDEVDFDPEQVLIDDDHDEEESDK